MTSQDKFQRLLDNLPKIAEAVNSFESPEVQSAAFEALVKALGLVPGPSSPDPVDDTVVVEEVEESSDASEAAPGGSKLRKKATHRTRTTTKKTFVIPKGLNFAPAGRDSLESVISAKKPKTQLEKNLVAVRYLSEYMGESQIDTGKVLAVWRAAGWAAPNQPDVVLRNTAVKGWLDTSDMSDIKVVWQGENYFDTKMPREVKAPKT